MKKSRTLYDSFEIRGKWAFPTSENVVPGTLYYQNGRAYLITEGVIGEKDIGIVETNKIGYEYPKPIPIIMGHLTTGEKVTLVNNTMTQITSHFHGDPICRYNAEQMFIGEHFESEENIIFEKLFVDYSNLKTWYGVTGIEKEFHTENCLGSVRATIPSPTVSKINDNVEIKIRTSPSFSSEVYEQRVIIEETTSWSFYAKKPIKYEQLMEIANCYRHFLMLGMNEGVHYVSIMGKINDIEVEIYPNIILADELPIIKDPGDMTYSYHTIKNNFEQHIQAWWKIWQKYKDVIVNYFSTISEREQYMLESKFLTTAIALEAFHRAKFTEGKKFALRIDDLLDFCSGVFDDPENEKKNFITKVVKTRDYHAHGSAEFKVDAVTDVRQLLYLTQEMQILIEGCFLHELPFDTEAISQMMRKNRKNKNYVRDNENIEN